MTVAKTAYKKGYSAGRRRQYKEDQMKLERTRILNERFTTLAAAIMTAGMAHQFGCERNGKWEKYHLGELEEMAVNSALRMCNKMDFL